VPRDVGRLCAENPFENPICKTLLLYRGEKPAKPHRTNQRKPAKMSPIYKEAEKTENVSGEVHFSLISRNFP
jgi:hypothetical protein